MQQRVEGEGKYIKAKTYLMRMINNTTAMYLNLGLLDFIKIAITYMNIYVFSHKEIVRRGSVKFGGILEHIFDIAGVNRVFINRKLG